MQSEIVQNYLLFKKEISKCSLTELIDELEFQVKKKTIAKYVSKYQPDVEEAEYKIFLLKIRILELSDK